MKALVGAFNQEKALVGAFSVIVKPIVEPMDRFTALLLIYIYSLWLCDADQANNGNNVRPPPPSLTSRLMTSVSAYKDAH